VEREVTGKGWILYGPVQSYATTTVFTAMSGVDGMCRPMGYQAFVYAGGRFAGTLSPAPMNAREDSSLTVIRLLSPGSIMAEFNRYSNSDPFCCPSRISTVNYSLRSGTIPSVKADEVSTLTICHDDEPPAGNNANEATLLFGTRWTLTAIGDRRLSAAKPYIEFDGQQRRVSGDGGCNRFAGGFELSGTSLKLGNLISTKRACMADEANRLETSFLQALGETTRFEIQGKTLRLYAGDRQLLTFSSQ
jgi:heat shock protein HslJ